MGYGGRYLIYRSGVYTILHQRLSHEEAERATIESPSWAETE